MAASHSSVAIGGKSVARCRIPAPGASSGMAALLDYLQQVAERGLLRRLGMNEEDGSAAGALTRCGVDQLEAVLLHVIVSLLDIGHPQGHMRHPATAAVLFDLLR